MPFGVSSPSSIASKARGTRAALWAGCFTNGVWDMLSVVVPLYAASVGLSAADIGFIIAARSVLPAALSIHGGIVMDYWGTRRVLLWVSVACLVLPLLYPATSWFPLLAALQLILGLASALSMAAAQTWILQHSHDTAMLAQFSLVSRIGSFLGPLMVGAVWDFLGAWAAFVCISVWAFGIIAATGIASGRDDPQPDPASATERRAIAVLVPQWRAHKQALALAAIPAVAFVLAVSFLRNAPGAIQSSMYVVYLGDIGFTGTAIGALVSVCEFFGVAGSMLAAPLERLVRAPALVLGCISASVLAIAVTPLVSGLFFLLAIAAGVRGLAQGMSQPLVYSLLGRSVEGESHGTSVGLRATVTRFASVVTPAAMGIAAEIWGIEASFYIMGAVFLLGTCALGAAVRSPSRRTS